MSEEIHSLLGRYFSGQATEEETKAVQQWIQADPANETEFGQLEKLWNRSGEHTHVPFDTEKAWQTVHARLNGTPHKTKVIGLSFKRIAIAAAACLVLAAGVWWMTSNSTGTQTILADIDVKKVVLEDGSSVYLRKGSTLSYPAHFEKDSRKVTLEGEAFFDVAHDKTKPFSISAADASVRVVGTSFSVNTANNKVELIVSTGIVNFSEAKDTNHRVTVIAGEKALLADGNVSKQSNGDINFNAWQTGRLVFNHTPLKEVVVKLADYYKVDFVLQEENKVQLETTEVTATFDKEALSSAIDELSMITTYQIKQTGENKYQVSIK